MSAETAEAAEAAETAETAETAEIAEAGWGLWLEPLLPVARLVELAQKAERLGASFVLVADEGTDRDVHVAMTAIAVATERIVIASAITNPYSRHPVATAAAFASLAELAPGRIVVGLGVGGSRVIAPLGIDQRRPFSALRESVDVVGRLLAGETVTHDGEFAVRAASLPWTPGALPLAIAGRGPRVRRLAAETADWALLAGALVADLPRTCADLRAAAGRASPVRVAWSAFLAWEPSMVEEIRPHFTYITVDLPADEKRLLGIDDATVERIRTAMLADGMAAAARHVPDAVVERYAVVGDRAAVAARLRSVRTEAAPELFVLPLNDYDRADELIDGAYPLLVEAGFAEPLARASAASHREEA